MLTPNEIGGKIAVARKLKNISQAELAEQLAVSAQAVGKWERGESMPDILMFSRLAAVLGTDVNYFVGESSEPPGIETVSMPNAPLDENTETERLGWNMSGGNWVDADFSGLHGLAEKFSSSNIEKCRFIESEMAGLALKSNNIVRSDFSRSDMRHCEFKSANLQHSIFVGCNFNCSRFSRCNVSDCDFSETDLTDIHSKWGNFKKVNLTGAILYKTKFELGQLTEVTFTGELTECSFVNCDMARVVFDGAVLRDCFFKNTKLKRAKFINCKADKLTYAFMKSCKADLSDVTIIEE